MAWMEKYTLIITEKPEAAQRIAQALDYGGKPEKDAERKVPYFRAHRDKELVIVPALGHLYTVVHEQGTRNYYPVFNFKWAPRYLAERNAKNIRTWIEVISRLAQNAEEFIHACDYDLEGSLIGYCVLKYACQGREKDAKRMKFSTLTKEELEKAYEELLPQLDFEQIEAGKTRHEVDWLYGVNLSRALTLAAKRWSGKYATLSTGRVQGPTLRFLVEREKEIQCFVPVPYWDIKAEVEIQGSLYEVEYEKKRIERRAEADAMVEVCQGKTGDITEVELKEFQQAPPVPFDLGSLQAEAYSFFGYTPRQTLNIAERLYLQALISYPRTSSQKLPPVINYRGILSSLSKERNYKNLAQGLLERAELRPNEGKKEDPAHPAVYPTGNLPENPLSDPEKRIWDLVVRRFMAVFGEPTVKQSIRVNIEVDGHLFYLRGRRVLKDGWTRFYEPYIKFEEVLLPPLHKGEKVQLRKVVREDKFTNPPARYNPSSLLKKMEDEGIGTKCLCEETQILLRRVNGKLDRINVENLYEECAKNSSILNDKNGCEIVKNNSNFVGLSMLNGEILDKPFSEISKRKINPEEKVYEVLFDDGSAVCLTDTHPVFVLDNKTDTIKCTPAKIITKDTSLISTLPWINEIGDTIVTWEDFAKKCDKKASIYGLNCGDLLKQRRKEMGLSQRKLSKEIGYYQGNVCSFERGKRDVPLHVLYRLNIKPNKIVGVNKNFQLSNPFPLKMSSSLARILANLIGDGSLDLERLIRENAFDLRYHNTNLDLIHQFTRDISDVFGVQLKYRKQKGKGPLKEKRLPRYYVKLPCLLGRILCMIAEEIITKDAASILPEKFFPFFIGGLFDDEGHAYKDELKLFISNNNPRLLKRLQEMLTTIGVESSIQPKSPKLFVYGRRNIEKFLDKIRFVSIDKKRRLAKNLSQRSASMIKKQIMSYVSRKPLTTNDLSRLTGCSESTIVNRMRELREDGLVEKVVEGNNKDAPRIIRYEAKKSPAEMFFSLLGERIITRDLITKKVQEVKEKAYDGFIYDLSIDLTTPNFVLGNGLVVHNSTRADIVETLYSRGYIADRRIVVTSLGFDVTEVLNEYCPNVVSVELTRDLEEKMEKIQNNREERENVLLEAVDILKPALEELKEREETIGEVLSDAIKRAKMQERIIGRCPQCGTGNLMILFSRKTGKRFIGCTNYFKGLCKNSFPLPQRGTLKPMQKNCNACEWPLIEVRARGRRPWRFCFNPNCPSREAREKRP